MAMPRSSKGKPFEDERYPQVMERFKYLRPSQVLSSNTVPRPSQNRYSLWILPCNRWLPFSLERYYKSIHRLQNGSATLWIPFYDLILRFQDRSETYVGSKVLVGWHVHNERL